MSHISLPQGNHTGRLWSYFPPCGNRALTDIPSDWSHRRRAQAVRLCKYKATLVTIDSRNWVFLPVFFGISFLLSVESSLSLTNSEKQGGVVREAGLGRRTCNRAGAELSPRAEFRAQSVHSHMPRQKGEKEQAMAAVSRIYRYQGSLVFSYIVERLARAGDEIQWTNQMGYITVRAQLPGIYGNVNRPCPRAFALGLGSVYCHKSLATGL